MAQKFLKQCRTINTGSDVFFKIPNDLIFQIHDWHVFCLTTQMHILSTCIVACLVANQQLSPL